MVRKEGYESTHEFQDLLRLLESREERWRLLLRDTGADKLEGQVRVTLTVWRSGIGINSLVVDIHRAPLPLREAIWRLNEHFDAIMSAEGGKVNVPAPVPRSLGYTFHPGIDVAGLHRWDGFYDVREDRWDGLLAIFNYAPHGLELDPHSGLHMNADDLELRSAIADRKGYRDRLRREGRW